MTLPTLDFTGLVPGDLDTAAFERLSLLEQMRYCGRERVKRGLRPWTYVQQEMDGPEPPDETVPDWAEVIGTAIYRQVLRAVVDDPPARAWTQYADIAEIDDFRPRSVRFVPEWGDLDSCLNSGYTMLLRRLGRTFTFPFIAVENDDQGLLYSLPEKLIRTLEGTIGKVCVRDVLEGPATAYDGGPLFYRDDAWGDLDKQRPYAPNLLVGAAARFSHEALVMAGRMVQVAAGDRDLNPSRRPLGYRPRWLVVPPTLAFEAMVTLDRIHGLCGRSRRPEFAHVPHTPVVPAAVGVMFRDCHLVVDRDLTDPDAWYLFGDGPSPVWVALRTGRGLRPRMWRNAPPEMPLMGGSADDYLLTISDLTFGISFDLGAGAACPWGAFKFAPGRPPGARPVPTPLEAGLLSGLLSEVRQPRDLMGEYLG